MKFYLQSRPNIMTRPKNNKTKNKKETTKLTKQKSDKTWTNIEKDASSSFSVLHSPKKLIADLGEGKGY